MMSSRFFASLFLNLAVFAAGLCFAETPYEKSALVRVNVVNELEGARDALMIRGRLLDEYNPTVIQYFSTPGVVLDSEGHIMTFLGYGRIFVEKEKSRFEIASSDGQVYKGGLVGIDHGNGAAVIRVPDGNLVKTAICIECDIQEGATVVAPVFISPGRTQFQATQVISIQPRGVARERAGQVIRMNRPFLDVGQPFFTDDNRVLGFIVSQDPSGIQNVVYTVSDLLDSAQKIIEENGDIRTGWLGLYSEDIRTPSGPAVRIQGIVKDSPAQKAGLAASDIVLRYNDEKVDNVLGFIHLVQDTPVGTSVNLEILRQGRPMKLTASIQEREYQNPLKDMMLDLQDPFEPPQAQIYPGWAPQMRRPQIGFETVDLTPKLADLLQVRAKTGLLVVNIVRQSPADKAGLKNRDIILSVDENPIKDAQEASAYLQSLNPGSVVSMKVLRNNSERIVHLKLPE